MEGLNSKNKNKNIKVVFMLENQTILKEKRLFCMEKI